jgi:septal ring factor EnvC (AmiA/AmiB activator)
LAEAARGEAERLRTRQAAAAQAIVATEATLAEAQVREREMSGRLEAQRRRLAEEGRPTALLLAGVAQLGRQPPLLALADARSVGEMVHLGALLDSSLPALAARTAALRTELHRQEALAAAARQARADAIARRHRLTQQQRRFAALEARTSLRLAELGTDALAAGDVALTRRSEADRAAGAAAEQRVARRTAAQLSALAPPLPRPVPPVGRPEQPPIAWRLLRRSEPLGHALGNVTVELSRDGRPQPAALIAGSSALLSNGANPS